MQSIAAKQIELASRELQRVQKLVEIGVESRTRLHQAEQDLADAQDNAILQQNLYNNAATNVDESAIREMVDAAQRRLDRQQERVDHTKALLTQGLIAQSYLTPFEQELALRQTQFDLAQYRARIMQDAVSKAEDAVSKAEDAASKAQQAAADAQLRDTPRQDAFSTDALELIAPGEEHYEGNGAFSEARDLQPLAQAFARRFDYPLPISAEGETNLHRAMGFDHRGRVDVAINPQTPEGVWLRHYLQVLKIPYYAFTRAIPGKATAAHIHIGPGSTRLQNAD